MKTYTVKGIPEKTILYVLMAFYPQKMLSRELAELTGLNINIVNERCGLLQSAGLIKFEYLKSAQRRKNPTRVISIPKENYKEIADFLQIVLNMKNLSEAQKRRLYKIEEKTSKPFGLKSFAINDSTELIDEI